MAKVISWDARTRRKMPVLPDTLGPYDMQVVVINYEAFATPGKKLESGRRSKASGRFKTRKTLLDWASPGSTRRNDRNVAMILDESHKIKRSEENTSELQSLISTSYAVFCLKKKQTQQYDTSRNN